MVEAAAVAETKAMAVSRRVTEEEIRRGRGEGGGLCLGFGLDVFLLLGQQNAHGLPACVAHTSVRQ